MQNVFSSIYSNVQTEVDVMCDCNKKKDHLLKFISTWTCWWSIYLLKYTAILLLYSPIKKRIAPQTCKIKKGVDH